MWIPKTDNIPRLNWIRRNLKIVPKMGNMCFLEPNIGQLMLWNSMNLQRDRDLPVRIVLLKPRQVGWSTWSCAEAFAEAYWNQYFNTGLFSLDDDSTEHIFRMIRLFADELSGKLKRPLESTNRKEVIFARPHRSRMLSQTAGKKGAGHSYTFRYIHCSEVSRWKDATNTMGGILQSVSNSAGTSVVIESTANGMGGYFYEMYWDAVDRMKYDPNNFRGFLPVFFPWFRFPEYSEPVPPKYKLTEEERDEQNKHGLDVGQILWRRSTIQGMSGDIGKFKEEFPATALEAFQASGNPVFSEEQMRYQKKTIEEAPRSVVLEMEGGEVKLHSVDRSINSWQIRRMPTNTEYTLGIDTREDKLSDTTDLKSELDWDGAAVFNRSSREYDAIWKGQTEGIDFAKQCFCAAVLYNEAFVVPEIPKGMHVLRYFVSKDYQNIYSRTRHEERGEPEDTDVLGFRTDMTTRRWLVEDFKTAIHEKTLRICFQTIYDEMETFIKDKTGKAIHMPSKHDDVLFGAFLALQGDIRLNQKTSRRIYLARNKNYVWPLP